MQATIDILGCSHAAFWHAFGVSAAVVMLAVTVALAFSLYADWVNNRSVQAKALMFIVCSLAFAVFAGAVGAAGTYQALSCIP